MIQHLQLENRKEDYLTYPPNKLNETGRKRYRATHAMQKVI